MIIKKICIDCGKEVLYSHLTTRGQATRVKKHINYRYSKSGFRCSLCHSVMMGNAIMKGLVEGTNSPI